MEYDANGNLIIDRDRQIKRIAYNCLNLPDTVYFDNGNLIVNNYDASGYKYKSTYYTVLATILTPYDTVSNYNFANDSIDFYITEYSGNLENYYTREDTVRKVFNTEGYYQDSAYYYFYKDHLGSNRAVKNLTRDTVVQRTQYYASGLPIVSSTGQSLQNRKYNGKEFVEAYGLDEYDSYARYYYPAIMRTTTPDPLAEKYYDLSPYAWCGNNPVNFVDPFGLDTINIDGGGNVVSTIKSDEADVINIVEEDEDGNYVVKVDDDGNPISVSFKYGTIENQMSYNTNYMNKKDETIHNITMDVFRVRGDANAKKLFQFLSDIISAYSGIEYSWFATGIAGDKGLNFITTGHEQKSDGSGPLLFMTQLQNGYTIRAYYHSHPNSNIVSDGDYNFQEYVLSLLMNNGAKVLPYFNIYYIRDMKYYRY